MNRIPVLSSALAAVAAVFLVTVPAAALPRVGDPAPAFEATDTQGEAHRLADYRGSVVVLEWTSHECPFVQKHYGTGNMQDLQRLAAARDVTWLSVISSAPGRDGHVSPAEADRLTQERDAAPAAVILDPEGTVGRAYGAKTTPHMFVIDREGQLAYMGGIDDIPSARWSDVQRANNYVRSALDAMEAGEAVDPAVTRPYGCSVKY